MITCECCFTLDWVRLCGEYTVPFKYLTILSTYSGFNSTCNVSMSSLNQAGTQDKMSTNV